MDENLEWMFGGSGESVSRTPYRGEIGNLESLLDELIGYTPSEVTTLKARKRQYAERMSLIEQSKKQAPPEIVEQINKLQDKLIRLRRAKEIQSRLDEELTALESNQKTNKNIERVIEIIKVSGTRQQATYKSEFLQKMKDRPLIINYAGRSVSLEEYAPC